MNRLALLRGYPAPRDGASPACSRGLACPSLQVTGVDRLVKLGMLLPFTSVVTVLSKVVSNVLWLIWVPLRLDIVSSKFCLRSAMFFTVLILLVSGSSPDISSRHCLAVLLNDKSILVGLVQESEGGKEVLSFSERVL